MCTQLFLHYKHILHKSWDEKKGMLPWHGKQHSHPSASDLGKYLPSKHAKDGKNVPLSTWHSQNNMKQLQHWRPYNQLNVEPKKDS